MNFEVKQEPIENSSEHSLTENNNMAAEVHIENVEQDIKTDIPIKIEQIEQFQTNTLMEDNVEQVRTDIQSEWNLYKYIVQ